MDAIRAKQVRCLASPIRSEGHHLSNDRLDYFLGIAQRAHSHTSRPLAPKAVTQHEKIGGLAGFVAANGCSLDDSTLNLILEVLGFDSLPEVSSHVTETQVAQYGSRKVLRRSRKRAHYDNQPFGIPNMRNITVGVRLYACHEH
jgi:hypothetical protein